MIGGWQAIRLIARREIVTRGRERSFFISTGLTLVILAAIIFLPSVLGGGDDTAKVAYAGSGGAALSEAVRDVGDDLDVTFRAQSAGDDAAVRKLVEDGDADIGIVDDGRGLVTGGDASDEAVQALQLAARANAQREAARAAGLTPEEVRAITAPAALDVTDLGGDDGDTAQGFAFIVLFLLYGQILAYGITVATGVVEEKASRIVEILLATIQPKELLAGKVLGIGLLAFGQLLLTEVVGLVLASVSGQIDVGGKELATLPILLAWFVLGFGLYACAYAMGGALISRQEDINSVTTPLTMAILASFFLGFQANNDPDGPLAQVLSLVPLSSPLVMPVRVIGGDVPAWEIVVSVALSVAAIVLVVRLAGRMYGNAVLQTGGRVSLRSALRQGS